MELHRQQKFKNIIIPLSKIITYQDLFDNIYLKLPITKQKPNVFYRLDLLYTLYQTLPIELLITRNGNCYGFIIHGKTFQITHQRSLKMKQLKIILSKEISKLK